VETGKLNIRAAMLPLGVAVLTVAFALFALGAIKPPATQVSAQADGHGNSYSGAYVASFGEFVGKVQAAFAEGVNYEGELADGRFSGPGKVYGDGWQMEGTFIDGRLAGQGAYSDEQGSYEGAFEDSLPQGNGVYRSNSGWRYEGEFLAGAMTGQGTVYVNDVAVYSGTWQDGIFMGEG
jgi:hypothetical protein